MKRVVASAVVSLLLSGCQEPTQAPETGNAASVAETPVLVDGWTKSATLSPDDLAGMLGQFEEGRWTLEVAGVPVCGVDVFHYTYRTVDGKGAAVTATSGLMVPRGSDPKCSNPNPIIVGLHGTMPDKPYNLADVSGTNSASGRALAWAGVYASQGYIVVAPNYTGLDTSTASHQSYMDAKQQSQDVIDALSGARELLPDVQGKASDKLFLVGYSQGGWVAMATHRELEARGMSLTASVPMSGAYALSALVDDIFMGRPVRGSTLYFPLAIRAFQEAYGDIYADPSELFAPKFASDVPTLLPSDIPHPQLIAAGRLPASAIFNGAPSLSAAGADAFVAEAIRNNSPAREPAQFAAIYATGFGPDHLINDSFRIAYLKDVEAHPDGASPSYTTGERPKGSANALRQAAIRNDLRDWTPKAPLMMCGGQGDAATPFRFGAELMMRYWSDPSRAPAPGIVSMLDFEAAPREGDQYRALKEDFRQRRDQIISSQDWPVWVDAYHQVVLPRYCYLAARNFFDAMR